MLHVNIKIKTLIFDFGTCLTIDVVNDNKEFLGGRISPGLIMRYKSLNYYTDFFLYVKLLMIESL